MQSQVIAIDDIDTTDEDMPIVLDVQANDINLEEGALITVLISVPEHGTAEVLDSDSILYIPELNYYGIDTFTYQVYNDAEFPEVSSAQVVIDILPKPDYPIAFPDYDTTFVEIPKLIDVQGNDINFDPEFLVTNIVTAPLNGTTEVIGGISILYTPADDFFGDDMFTYAVCNPLAAGFCDTATVFIHVIEVNFFYPELENDFVTLNTEEIQTINVLANDIDGDGDALYVAAVIAPEITGSIILNPDYTVTYNAPLTETIDSIFYIGCDVNSPSYCDTALLHITVTKIPDAGTSLIIPNAFSPNGDGYLDQFIITGISPEDNTNLKIFNRWGNLVFESEETNISEISWNGNANVASLTTTGTLPEGTYFYLLQINETTPYQGYIDMRR